MAKKNKYYVVWQGKEPGIYDDWDKCNKQISGFNDAKYKGFATKEEAELAFAGSWEEYYSPAVRQKVAEKNLLLLPESDRPQYPSLAVDAACSGNPGLMEYRGVDAKTCKEIFHQGPFECGTNNIGEFLAIVHGLALIKQKNANVLLYSDSMTAQSWVKQKKCKTKLEENSKNHKLFELIRRAEKWLNENSYSTHILKWNTEKWGEIPADFGRK